MICQLLGGPEDGNRIEVCDDPPSTLIVAARPSLPLTLDLTLSSADALPNHYAYQRRTYVSPIGGRHFAYFLNPSDVAAVVMIVMPHGRWPASPMPQPLDPSRLLSPSKPNVINGGGLYLTRPKRVVGVGGPADRALIELDRRVYGGEEMRRRLLELLEEHRRDFPDE